MATIECPVCGTPQPADTIESHINKCLDSQANGGGAAAVPPSPAPAPVSAKRPIPSEGSPEGAPERKQPAQDLIAFEPITNEADRSVALSLMDEDEKRRRKEEEENERLLREFLAAEEKARIAEAERAAAAVNCTCPICKQAKGIEAFFYFDACPHSFCRDCLKADLLKHCAECTPSKACCQTCGAKYTPREVKELLGADAEKYDAAMLKETINSNPNLVSCPKCNLAFERLAAKPQDINQSETGPDGRPLSREALVHKSEFRFSCRECRAVFCASCKQEPYHLGFTCEQFKASQLADHCRFCNAVVGKGESVCNQGECRDKLKMSCTKKHQCGHLCRGIAGEKKCLPCLDEACVPEGGQTSGDFCNICWTEDLGSAPSVLLDCKHVFHLACVRKKLEQKWPTPAISFNFANCPLCQQVISHEALTKDMKPIKDLMDDVKKKAVVRAGMEGLDKDWQKDPALKAKYPDMADYAVHVFAFYMCFKCKKPYFGGKKSCAGAMDEKFKFDPKNLLCGSCSGADIENCPTHGKDYIEYKCRFCCALATFFCGGKAHFCNPCHDKAAQLVEFAHWKTIKECPPCKGPGACPLGVVHKPNGQESSLGCAMCRANR